MPKQTGDDLRDTLCVKPIQISGLFANEPRLQVARFTTGTG